jgi:hypothetical protein
VSSSSAAARLTSLEEISQAAQLFGDLGHLAGGHALHVHLGQGQPQGLLAAAAALQDPRIKLRSTDLRHGQFQRADAGLERLLLEAVGLAAARLRALVRADSQELLPLELQAFVKQQLHGLGHAVKAVLGQHLDDFASNARMRWVGHG